jgi:hypothetical protein
MTCAMHGSMDSRHNSSCRAAMSAGTASGRQQNFEQHLPSVLGIARDST